MSILKKSTLKKKAALLGAAALLGTCSLTALAQQAPDATPPAEKPPMTRPEAAPAPAPTPPSATTSPKATQAAAAKELIGLTAFSSDGSKVGDVRAVTTTPDGKVTLHLRTGGFLGFGGRIVAIPDDRYTRSAQSIRLALTADEVSKLPEVKDAS